MATTTASVVSTIASAVLSTASATSTPVPPQTGILEGGNPIVYNKSNPIVLFIIQAAIVIIVCQLLHYPLRLINQPRVIAEVIGGIVLGPSVMMKIPYFQTTIFPTDSMPVFSNVANLGLVIFLFLVALEVDMRLFMRNWRVAVSVGLAGMILPFGLGFAIAYGLYHQFTGEGTVEITFGVYGLFIGTALSITAFPVLCRILTELKLLRCDVGVTVLAAGVGNDVVGWILLALCVALVNNANGLAALYALLTCIAWILFLVFAIRPAFIWILRRTGSLQNGPTQGMVALTMLMVLISAWFTQIIGIHAIFGAFLVGLICPHDGGFAIKLTEKIEDLISVLFLPLYFALSGLSTDISLLNDGITWAYVVGVIACAFAGKIIGGTLAARANKLLWRESLTIGCLMSCKGLVELIVLNIGLQARILSKRTFTMFVVMALVTTVATTPLTKALYPPWYQKKLERWRKGEIDWDGNPTGSGSTSERESIEKLNEGQIRRLIVYLRLDSLPSLFTFITLLGHENKTQTIREEENTATTENTEVQIRKRPLEVHGLRILELTDRTSSVMQVTEGEEFYSLHDPVVNAFRTFSQLNDVAVSGRVAVVPSTSYAETLMTQASEVSSDFALIPWSEWGSVTEDQSVPYSVNASDRFKASAHLEFVQSTLRRASTTCNAGIFINNGFGGLAKPVDRPQLLRSKSAVSIRSYTREPAALPVMDKSHHVFFPFFGGVDDRVALRFVLQLAKNPLVSVTIVHVNLPADDGDEIQFADPRTDDNISKGAEVPEKQKIIENVTASDLALLATLQSSLPRELVGRVVFREISVTIANVLQEAMSVAKETVGKSSKNAGDIVVLGRTHPRLGDNPTETTSLDLKKTVGALADQVIAQGIKASLLVIQAGGQGRELSRFK